jgi:hypothetical protein
MTVNYFCHLNFLIKNINFAAKKFQIKIINSNLENWINFIKIVNHKS